MVREIELTQGKVALVDDADYVWLNQWKWHATKIRHTFYARRWRRKEEKGATKLSMHRLILGLGPGFQGHHINGNGLDNQCSNLRSCSPKQHNSRNGPKRGGSSHFKGVSFTSNPPNLKRPWVAQAGRRHQKCFLGRYATEEEAARAYNEAATQLYGEFVWLNQLPEEDPA